MRCSWRALLSLLLYHTEHVYAWPWTHNGDQKPLQLPLSGSRGAVSSETDVCSQIGIDLIQQGGNAADALIGAQLCVGVIGMYHSGLGGGGFLLVRDAEGNYESVDYRESAPAAAAEDMYRDNFMGSLLGGLAAGVPGELRGLDYLHKKYGALSWRKVVEPSVRVARNGFRVNEDHIRYFQSSFRDGKSFLVENPVWAEDFAPDGTLVTLGDVMTRKRYANTLEKIGEHGVDLFYEGEMAEEMIKIIQDTNGTMTLEDLREYKVITRQTVGIEYRGFKVYATSTPTSGSVCLSVLKTMEQYPLSDAKDANLTIHRFNEAMRFAYGARMELGDPHYVSNMALYEDRLLSASRAKQIRRRILDNTTQPVAAYDPRGEYAPPGHGTSHIVAADASGLVITSTTTINTLFGAQIMTPRSGIIINNEMNDFSIPGKPNEFGFPPAAANFIRPGKRPLSSITPLIAEFANGSVYFATGAAGGSRIISATMQAAWHVLEHGMTAAEALAEPRLHDQLIPNQVTLEYTFDNSTAASLIEKGHNVTWVRLGGSAVQAVRRLWDGTFEAASEPRQLNSGGFTT